MHAPGVEWNEIDADSAETACVACLPVRDFLVGVGGPGKWRGVEGPEDSTGCWT